MDTSRHQRHGGAERLAAIGEREFGALVSGVVQALDEHGIAPRDVDTVASVLQTPRAGG